MAASMVWVRYLRGWWRGDSIAKRVEPLLVEAWIFEYTTVEDDGKVKSEIGHVIERSASEDEEDNNGDDDDVEEEEEEDDDDDDDDDERA
jgi:hypothetical protein